MMIIFVTIWILLNVASIVSLFLARKLNKDVEQLANDFTQKIQEANNPITDSHISLSSDDFECLVAGGILTVTDKKTGRNTHIVLQDIGFDAMRAITCQVEQDKQFYPVRQREN